MSLLRNKLILLSFTLVLNNSFAAGGGQIGNEMDIEVPDVKEITGDIVFKGTITDSSCDILQKDKEVELGEHSVSELKNSGDKTDPETFDISLINCSLAMTSLKIKMDGTAHKDNAVLYALEESEESAGNVGISITTAEGQPIIPAAGYRNIPLLADSRDYTLSYAAAYQSTGLATPGTGNATIHYTVAYE